MPKMKFKCAGCGKEFEAYRSDRTGEKVYCTRECHNRNSANLRHGTGYQHTKTAWHAFNRMPFDPDIVNSGHGKRFHIAHAACYLKEARAMLQGKDTRGKNRCQKLVGDD